jgi:hypothetical protein
MTLDLSILCFTEEELVLIQPYQYPSEDLSITQIRVELLQELRNRLELLRFNPEYEPLSSILTRVLG